MAGLPGISGFRCAKQSAEIVIHFSDLYLSFKSGIQRLLVLHDDLITGDGLDGKEV
ncbi:hypothetical protein SDC9_88522 [bioreactor metagenome]|uniref:Uncharacterized protein n=1 Tax=bioreactor metagenome TaxID=1076179 RepID=A0A644ZM11_9ZZZZ